MNAEPLQDLGHSECDRTEGRLSNVSSCERLGLRGAVYGMLASAGAYSFALGIAFVAAVQGEGYAAPLGAATNQGPLQRTAGKI